MKKHIPAKIIRWMIILGLTFGSVIPQAQGNACTAPLSNDFYTRYSVVEGAVYVETNTASPSLNGSNAFVFAAQITLKTNFTASGATLAVPGKGPQAMRTFDSRHFNLTAAADSFSNLSAAFPGGDYLFVVSNDVTTVNLPDNSALPAAPSLRDYAAAQSINSGNNFTLQWNAFPGGQSKDFISVNVVGQFGNLFQSPAFGCPEALNGTATSIVIPANTLTANQIYRAEVIFVKVLTLNTNSLPDVALLAGTEAETLATIATSSESAPLLLTNAAALPSGRIRFDLTTTPGATYTIQFNPSLTDTSGWTSLLTTDAVGNLVAFTNQPATANGFYRALGP